MDQLIYPFCKSRDCYYLILLQWQKTSLKHLISILRMSSWTYHTDRFLSKEIKIPLIVKKIRRSWNGNKSGWIISIFLAYSINMISSTIVIYRSQINSSRKRMFLQLCQCKLWIEWIISKFWTKRINHIRYKRKVNTYTMCTFLIPIFKSKSILFYTVKKKFDSLIITLLIWRRTKITCKWSTKHYIYIHCFTSSTRQCTSMESLSFLVSLAL